jgi:hypothetical protein
MNNQELNTVWTLDCSYYTKEFSTLQELIDDVMYSGMDPSYEILRDGKKTGEELADFIVH